MGKFSDRVLDNNIKCGNSLIGPDFYDNQELALFGEEDFYRINVFDWRESFPDVFDGGEASGFDAVVGNPPYIRIQHLKEFAPVEVEHYKGAYRSAGRGNYDIYVAFVEKGLQLLGRDGRLGYILPHKFFNAKYGEPVREVISSGDHLAEVVHFGDEQVFKGATTYTCLMFLDKKGRRDFDFARADDLSAWRISGEAEKGEVPARSATSEEWNFVVGRGAGLFEKLRAMPVKLGDVASIFVGLQTSADTVFLFKDSQITQSPTIKLFSKELDQEVEVETGLLKSVVRSGSIGRYWAEPTALVLFPYELEGKSRLIPEAEMKSRFPTAWRYLKDNEELLSNREHGKFVPTGWYQLYPKNLDVWEQPKIMLPYMITRLAAFYDEGGSYFVNVTTGGFGITTNPQLGDQKYATGLLNSRLLDWFIKKVSTNFNSGYFAANKQFLVQLPIRPVDFSDAEDVERHDRMVSLVDRMMDLNKQLASARIAREKTVIGQQIAAADRQIDRLVYELYGLTDEEVEIVEEAGG